MPFVLEECLVNEPLLKSIVANHKNTYYVDYWDIETATAHLEGNSVVITYSYDEYPIAFGKETVYLSIEEFTLLADICDDTVNNNF